MLRRAVLTTAGAALLVYSLVTGFQAISVVPDTLQIEGETSVQAIDRHFGNEGQISRDDLRHGTELGSYILYLWTGCVLLLMAFERGTKRSPGPGEVHTMVRAARRSAFVLMGVALLAVTCPQSAPWQMKYIRIWPGEPLLAVSYFSRPLVLSWCALACCFVAVVVGLVWASPAILKGLRSARRQPRRFVMLLLGLAGLVFTVQPFFSERRALGIASYLLLGTLGISLTLMGAIPLLARVSRRDPVRRAARGLATWFYGIPAWLFLGLLFIFVFTAANLISYYVFEHVPHVQDSVGQAFHARIFLLGQLTAPSPPPELREFFGWTHMINNGQWYSQYPPGHILMLTLGHAVGAPWIVNPFLGALSVVLMYFIGKEIYGEAVGRLAALMGALSPFLIFMSSEFMNHSSMLFFTELFILGFARLVNRQRFLDAALSGFALGYTVLIRPLTALAVAVPFALFALAKSIRLFVFRSGSGPDAQHGGVKPALRWTALCCVCLVTFGLMASGMLIYNQLVNGDPFLFSYSVAQPKLKFGFGPSPWGAPHSPSLGLTNSFDNLIALNKYLFELPVPSLLLAVLVLARRKRSVWDFVLLSLPLSISVAYFFYFFQDWCFGPRFLFASTAACVLLAARGISGLPSAAEDLFGADKRVVKGVVAVGVVLCLSVGFGGNVPSLIRFYSNNYWGVNGKIVRWARELKIRNAVVFVRSWYGAVLPANDPLLKGDVIYVKDRGSVKNEVVKKHFPNRIYFWAE
jgi:hypothetical protein